MKVRNLEYISLPHIINLPTFFSLKSAILSVKLTFAFQRLFRFFHIAKRQINIICLDEAQKEAYICFRNTTKKLLYEKIKAKIKPERSNVNK